MSYLNLARRALEEFHNPILTPDVLTAEWHLLWDERAAIREYQGNMPRERAEAAALEEIQRLIKAENESGEPCDRE